MDVSFVLFAVVTFLAVVLALEGAYNLWASGRSPEARRITARLEALSGEASTTASIARNLAPARMLRLNALLAGTGLGQRMHRFISASAIAVSPAELVLLSLVLGTVGFVLPGLFGKPPQGG